MQNLILNKGDPMIKKHIYRLFYCLFIFTSLINATELKVSKSGQGAQFSTIQAAVDASKDGDIITILDASVYEERVVIQNKTGLTLQSANPDDAFSSKPTILYKDTINVGPKTASEALVDSLLTYRKNGALLIFQSSKITVKGLNINGGAQFPFGYSAIWNSKDAFFGGNSAITINKSGMVTIRNCDISNAFSGIYVSDMNYGGIYAQMSLVDGDYSDNVDISAAFRQTGNHCFEFNSIHNNSFGIAFDLIWNQGAIVRFNKIYNNHYTEELYDIVKELPDGNLNPGGAMFFKNDMLTPVVIYNNTFWKNDYIFINHYEAAYQHLIFNNIFAEPNILWSENDHFQVSYMESTGNYVNRMKNCIFSSQWAAPSMQTQNYNWGISDPITGEYMQANEKYVGISRINILDTMSKVEAGGYMLSMKITFSNNVDTIRYFKVDFSILPGAYIVKPFSKIDNNRWIEMKFLSTDPLDPSFLIPQWSDSVITKYVKNGSWTDAPIYNKDKSLCNLGMASIENVKSVRNIIPLEPAYINNGKAVISFELPPSDSFPDPKLEYFCIVRDLSYQSNIFGNNGDALGKADIYQFPLFMEFKPGKNIIEVPVTTKSNYGFVEMVFSSTSGTNTMNTVGIIPYRKFDPYIDLSLLDINTHAPVTTIKSGEKVLLRSRISASDTVDFTIKELKLISGEKIFRPDGSEFIVDSNALGLHYDTIVFKHTGTDAIVMRAQYYIATGMDFKQDQPVNSTSMFTIESDISVNNYAGKKQMSIKNSKAALYMLNGRKAGSYSAVQLNNVHSGKKQVPTSGMYVTGSENAKTGDMKKVIIAK